MITQRFKDNRTIRFCKRSIIAHPLASESQYVVLCFAFVFPFSSIESVHVMSAGRILSLVMASIRSSRGPQWIRGGLA